jgi:hypothetical protein
MPGNGPLGHLRPAVIIRKGSVRKSFRAQPTRHRGVYRVSVVFPSRGTWRYGVDDGFDRYERGAGRVHRFPAVAIGPGEPRLARAPRPVSGDIAPVVAPAPPSAAPVEETPARSEDPEHNGGPELAFVPAFLVPLFVGGVALRRRLSRGERS